MSSRKKEQRVWDAMKNHCPPNVRLERVENGLAAGLPDVHGISMSLTRWFELKHLDVPKLASTPMVKNDTFEVDQVKWHKIYAHFGGTSFAVARDDEMQLYLIPGRDIPPVLQPGKVGNAPRTALQALNSVQMRMRYGVPNWTELFKRAFAR